MAIARKCDRCGTCFDPLEVRGNEEICRFQNPIFQNAESLECCVVKDRLLQGGPDVMIDLCPECTRKFRLFMGAFGIFAEPDDFESEPDQ